MARHGDDLADRGVDLEGWVDLVLLSLRDLTLEQLLAEEGLRGEGATEADNWEDEDSVYVKEEGRCVEMDHPGTYHGKSRWR